MIFLLFPLCIIVVSSNVMITQVVESKKEIRRAGINFLQLAVLVSNYRLLVSSSHESRFFWKHRRIEELC